MRLVCPCVCRAWRPEGSRDGDPFLEAHQLREHLGTRFGFFGQLNPYKGVLVLLEAMALLVAAWTTLALTLHRLEWSFLYRFLPPPVVEGWVVRRVFDGAALVESRRGVIEVEPGDHLPGIGRIHEIKRQDGRWVVVTAKGLIMSVH